jgi:hypothetical protein
MPNRTDGASHCCGSFRVKQHSLPNFSQLLQVPSWHESITMAITPSTEVQDNEPVSDRAYGIIPIRLIPSTSYSTEFAGTISTANTQVLLIKQKSGDRSQLSYWTFPKGHAESNDLSNIHTAIREVKEETGLTIPESGILFKDAEGLIYRYRSLSRG